MSLESGVMKIFRRVWMMAVVAGLGCSASMHATKTEEQAVLAPVNALFSSMGTHDTDALKKTFLPGGTMTLMREGKPVQMTIEALADRVSASGTTKVEERIHDPLIRIDHDLAVVWARFEFLVDGKVDHCGTDLFNLVWVDGRWLIASVTDTGRKDCAVK